MSPPVHRPGRSRAGRHGQHRRRGWAALAAALVAVLVGLGLVLVYVLPPADEPAATDAVVVLGGLDKPARVERAREVLAEHPGAAVLIARPHPPQLHCPDPVVGAVLTECFEPVPATTRGEARVASELARERGYRSLTVVTTADQVERARLRFARCWPGELRVVQADTGWLRVVAQVPYQVAATAKALIWERGC